MGIEPTLFAWEAKVLPLNYTRFCVSHDQIIEVGAMRAAPKKAPAGVFVAVACCHRQTYNREFTSSRIHSSPAIWHTMSNSIATTPVISVAEIRKTFLDFYAARGHPSCRRRHLCPVTTRR